MFARVERGERLIVTRDSHPVAELRPLPARSAGPAELPVSIGTFGDELATVNPLVDGGQRNLGLTSDSSEFVCHRIECAQRV